MLKQHYYYYFCIVYRLFGKIGEWKRSSDRFQNKAPKGHYTMQNAILKCSSYVLANANICVRSQAGCDRFILSIFKPNRVCFMLPMCRRMVECQMVCLQERTEYERKSNCKSNASYSMCVRVCNVCSCSIFIASLGLSIHFRFKVNNDNLMT